MQAILFDTETTDLIRNTFLPLNKQPRIIEIYAKKIQLPPDAWGNPEEWQEIGEYEQLINPGMPISDEVERITGISDEMVRDAPSASEVWPDVVEFFTGPDMFVAHNLSYDRDIMNFEARRQGCENGFDWGSARMLCTVEGTMHLKGYRLSLTALHEHLFGEGFPNAHRAKSDVLPMERCFRHLWSEDEL